MNCVAECEYCKSVNVCIDSPNCNTTGHFCIKLNRLVSINKPVDEDCPFYFNKYSYRELINLRDSLISELYKVRVKWYEGATITLKDSLFAQDIEDAVYNVFNKLLDKQNGD